jgi:subtilisin family serine protease
MKNFHSLIVFLIFCLFAEITNSHLCFSDELIKKNYVTNEVLVRFHDWVDETEKEVVRNNLNADLVKIIKSIKVEYWKLPSNISTQEAVRLLGKMPIVEYVEPNFIHKQQATNDTFFNKQWALLNEGQNINGIEGTAGADIQATEAWNIFTGTNEVIVAVVDSGCAISHPDLQNNIWINESEYYGTDNYDDDGNGYIDDVFGWNFINDYFGWEVFGDNRHGTHVSGIIAATTNNNQGIAGTSINSKIMTLRVDKGTHFDTVSILDAFDYARLNGAKIVNCSFGGPNGSNSAYLAISLLNNAGILVIAAAGNGGGDKIGDNNDIYGHYPSGYDLPNIISVK